MSTYIKRIEATGIYDRFDIKQEFQDGINIIFGRNGAGKTTLLHILANALSGDFDRFRYLIFSEINISFSDGKNLQISRSDNKNGEIIIETKLGKKKLFVSPVQIKGHLFYDLEDDLANFKKNVYFDTDLSELQRQEIWNEYILSRRRRREITPVIPVAYFPAFRTMIEAWVAAATKQDTDVVKRTRSESWKDLATDRARDWFGGFTPMVNFPSLVDIEDQLANEIEGARANVWRSDQTLLSEAFFKILASLSDTSELNPRVETLSENIRNIFNELEQSPLKSLSRIDYHKLRGQISQLNISSNTESTVKRVLKIYRDTLQSTLDIQRNSFEGIQRYLSSVNEFLDDKSLVFKPDVPVHKRQSIQIRYGDESYSDGLRSLSSGERQIIALVYAATHMSQQKIVLIDEPEISLHVDWQRKLIKRMAEQMGETQIIACTHSPVIGADHLEKMQELSLSKTSRDLC
jgi:predicted ATPase